MDVSVSRSARLAILTFESGSMHRRLREELWDAITELDEDRDIGAVIITGRRNVFLAGADLKEVLALDSPEAVAQFLELPHRLVEKFCSLKKPLIAAINGYCLGGGLELALACDLRIAVRDFCDADGQCIPYIGFPEANIGLTPALGGAHLAAAIVGAGRAKELLFSARPVTAQHAHAIGLVNRLTTRARLIDDAKEMAQEILANAPLALSAAKRLVSRELGNGSLSAALGDARGAFAECCTDAETTARILRSREEQRTKFRKVVGAA